MAREKAPSVGNDKTQRRVYVLPNDLVERIIAYQNELGLSSEVEAARRLLDEALLSRDTIVSIVSRVIAQLKAVRSLREAAKEVLAGHPLVTRIKYENNELEFAIADGHRAEVTQFGKATIKDEQDELYIFWLENEIPEWASSAHKPKSNKQSPLSRQIDEDIPF